MNPTDRSPKKAARSAMLGALAAGTLLATAARADVITYDNGRVVKGVVRPLPDAPDTVEFTGAQGTVRIPRARIRDLQSEPPAQGWIHIGEDQKRAGRLPEAIAAFRKALDLDAGNAAAQKAIDDAQAAIADQSAMSRQDALRKVDELAAQAREEAVKRNFEQAEKLLQQANNLAPADEQKQPLAKQISRLYFAWGQERLDKLDPLGAERQFNLAIEADPDNSDAINELLKLWEGKADKREQAAHIYETIVERHPENTELRKKLGDLYGQMNRTEDMVRHYLEIYKQSDAWKGTPLERDLTAGLDKLHRQYARAKNYDQAIRTYGLLASIDANVDPTAVVYYQYMKQASALAPDDIQGRLKLAQFSEQNGLDEEALSSYRELIKSEPTREGALAGLTRYAQRAFAMAQIHYDNRSFSLARTLADGVRRDYPMVADVRAKADELIGRAQVESENQKLRQTEVARTLLRQGDDYYAQADAHFQNLFDLERRNNPRLISDRTEAQRYYLLAIQSYTEAVQLDPALARDPTARIAVRLNEAQRRLAALNQRPSGDLGRNSFAINARDRGTEQ